MAVRSLGAAVLVVVLGTAASLARPASAQQPPPSPSVTVNAVDASSYPDLRVVVTVLGADGLPVRGLQAAQFHLDDGGAAVPVSTVASAQDSSLGLTVVLAIDVSGSMQGTAIANARDAAVQFVRSLGPNDSAGIVAFSESVRVVVPVTADHARLEAAVAGLTAQGGTALYEAVQASSLLAVQSGAARRAVIVLTDGQNDASGSTATAPGSLDAAVAAHAPVFTIGFGADPDAAYLRSLADATQGQYTPATSLTVNAVYEGLSNLLRSQYVVTARATAPADGKDAALRVSVDAPSGGQASGSATFTRGVAPPLPAATETPPPASVAEPASGSNTFAIALAAAGGIVAVIVLALIGRRLLQRQRRRHRQEEIVEQNPQLASAVGVPAPIPGQISPNGAEHHGRLLALDASPPSAHTFGTRPLTLGYGPGCDVRIERSGDVAARHAQIWMREGKMMLRHIGGPRHATLVGGRAVDWVILEDGDEVRLGPSRWRAERVD